MSATVLAGVAQLGMRLAARALLRHRGPSAVSLASATATETILRLGPAFIKGAQLLSTRVDLLPRTTCRALARLYDRLPAVPGPAAAALLPPHLLAAVVGGADGLAVAGAGSIACVYRAHLRDGQTVAVKVRRPGIDRTVACDLAILRAVAALLQRLPGLRGAPVVEIASQVADCVAQQLDLAREADALHTLRVNLAEQAGVHIPAVVDAYCGPDVIVMEYVDGLRRGAVGAEQARTAAEHALRAVYHMLFLDGFVHCDLHPGNLYPMPDGSAVIVDAGFSHRLAAPARRAFASFFYQMSRGNGAACADVVLATARPAGPSADPAAFRADMTRLVEDSGVVVADFDLVAFAVRLFAIQRRHGFFADPQFVFPILSLIVLEGSLRQASPDIDFRTEALPFVLRGLMR